MVQTSDRKLYLGPRLRLLRRELGVSQTQMAEEIGVSPSYLNHLERNQRPLTAQMLLRLANTYDLDMRDFVSGAASAGTDAALLETMADPLVKDIGVTRDELLELSENYPGVAEALVRLHGALGDLRRAPGLVDRLATAQPITTSAQWLGAWLTARRNHMPTVETAAEALGAELPDDPGTRIERMRALLRDRFGVSVMWAPASMLGQGLRHYDFHRRRLMIAERLPAPSRAFAIAYQLAALGLADALEEQIAQADPPDAATRTLLKIALINYAAAALMMPYAAFHAAAEEGHYNPDLLAGRFGASFEQVAHRLTTLDRSGARGVPFFLLRTDRAGNVSKRLAGSADGPLFRAGPGCPRWAGHTGWIELPDGERYWSLARSVASPGIPREGGALLVTLVCAERHAARTQAPPPAPVAKIGPGCRLCERSGCSDRAAPPVAKTVEWSSIGRSCFPYPIRAT